MPALQEFHDSTLYLIRAETAVINTSGQLIYIDRLKMKLKNIGDKPMKPEYDFSKMQKRPNPFAKQLKEQVTVPLGIDVIKYFETMAKEEGISYQELINLYLQDCVVSRRKLSLK